MRNVKTAGQVVEEIEPYLDDKALQKIYEKPKKIDKNTSDEKTYVTSGIMSSESLVDALKHKNKSNFLAERVSNPKYVNVNTDGITKYFHNISNEILLSIRKYYLDEVGGGDNKTSFANLYERPTIEKV